MNFNILGGFSVGMKILWIFLGGHHKTGGLVLGSRMRIFFGVAKISNIFRLCLIFHKFFLVNSRCWIQALVTYEEKMRVTPPPWGFIVHHIKGSQPHRLEFPNP